MQHSRSYCNILAPLFPITLAVGMSMSAPAIANDALANRSSTGSSHTLSQSAAYTRKIRLSAPGNPLTLLLRPSRLTGNLEVIDVNGMNLPSPVRAYIGKIEGESGSWVRLTESRDSIAGVISRNGQRFQFDQTNGRLAKIKPLAENHDIRQTLKAAGKPRFAAAQRPAASVTRVAKIAIAVDSKFNARHKGRGLEYALTLINSVDGIYREEFGLALQVETAINVVDAATDPFSYGSVAIEQMLRSFRNFRLTTRLINNEVSLVHLFTGNKPVDEPVGLAWIDTACRTDGYDVGLSTPYKHDVLLVAHEIAHNLGALHDTDTACAASTDKVMWPYISAGTSQHFSSCTVETVKRTLARSCHAPAGDLEIASVDNPGRINNDYQPKAAAALAVELPHSHHDGD